MCIDSVVLTQSVRELLERNTLDELLPIINLHALLNPELEQEAVNMSMEERMLY